MLYSNFKNNKLNPQFILNPKHNFFPLKLIEI